MLPAAWFGAIYERMVSVLKKELTKLVGLSLLTYFELTSQLAEIEGIINSRPLTKFGAEDVLTPNSILTGEDNPNDILNVLDSQQILSDAHQVRNDLPRLFQETSKRRARFWQVYQQQYLESIKFSVDTSEHKGSGLTPKCGDIVILHAHDPRLKWRKAVIIEPILSADGQCRKCKIKTSTGITIRATKHMHPLELIAEAHLDQQKGLKEVPENDFLGFDKPPIDQRSDRALQLRDILSKRKVSENPV